MEPTVIDWLEVAQSIQLLLFVLFVGLGAFATFARYLRYRLENEDPPELLVRDMVARSTLFLPFGAILFVRLIRGFGVDVSGLVDSWWWIFGTSVPAVVGAAVYVWYEFRVIERDSDRHRRATNRRTGDAESRDPRP